MYEAPLLPSEKSTNQSLGYSGIDEMLALANLYKLLVEGDGHCGHYSVAAGRSSNATTHCHERRMPGAPVKSNRTDRQIVNRMRLDVKAVLLDPNRLAPLLRSWRQECCTSSVLCNWFWDKRLCTCEDKRNPGFDVDCRCDCLNRAGIAKNAMNHWSNHFSIRAMALLEGVDIVSINEAATNSNGLSDKVILLPGELQRPAHPDQYHLLVPVSWALDIVPRIMRQRAGTLEAGERPVRVIVYNGTNHYDATWPISM